MKDRSFASLVAFVLLALAVGSRVVPHPWNFTPVLAVALFAGARLGNAWVAGLAALACLALGDLAVGAFPYGGMEWVYGSLLIVVAIGRLLQTRRTIAATVVGALAGGFAFFVVTNFGVWLGGMYDHSAAGFVECYVKALPFYRNQLVGDLIFTGALFGLHALAVDLHARARAA